MTHTGATKGVALQPVLEMQHVWTFEDLQALPEDVDWRRCEIVDGALVVSPVASIWQEYVGGQLRQVLRNALPDGFAALGPLSVDLH